MGEILQNDILLVRSIIKRFWMLMNMKRLRDWADLQTIHIM